MKKQYDFSKGVRGKFFNKDIKFNLPVYLEPEIRSFIENIAQKKKKDISSVVNDLIKTDMKIVELSK